MNQHSVGQEVHWSEWMKRLAAYYSALLKHGGGAHSTHLHEMSRKVPSGYVADLVLFDIQGDQVLSTATIPLELGVEPESELEWENDEADSDADTGPAGAEEQIELAFLANRDRARSALMKIYKKQKTDPYNRETLFGYPLIGGRAGSKKVNGPLLFWEVDVRYDAARQRLFLNRRSPTPSLNTTLLSRFASDEASVADIKEQLLPILSTEAFGNGELEKTVAVVRGAIEPLKDLERFDASRADGLIEFLKYANSPGAQPAIAYWPVLLNGPRTYAFLLDDLDKIAKKDGIGGNSVAAQIVGDMPDGIGEIEGTALPFEDSADGGDPLWFPFESNRSQRRVAEAAQRAKVLTVQGPPGTGKSLTIANLVCDLVTRGNTVLVTSHQTKALEVVANKLPSIDYLAMAVLRDDRESMEQLKAQLASTDQVANESASEARQRLETLEEDLARRDRELRTLTRRYSELKEIENDGYSEHVRYSDIRELDCISPEDGPFDQDHSAIAAAVQGWSELARKLAPALADLSSLFRPEQMELTRVQEARLADAMATLCRLADDAVSTPSDLAREVLQQITGEGGTQEIAEELVRYRDWVKGSASQVLRHVEQEAASDAQDWRTWRERCRSTPNEELTRLGERLEVAETYLEDVSERLDLLSAEPPRLDKLLRAVVVLRSTHGSFWRWYIAPSARRARAALEGAGYAIPTRATAESDLDELDEVLTWFKQRRHIKQTLEQVQETLPEWRGAGDAKTPPALAGSVRSAARAVRLVQELQTAPLLSRFRPPYPEIANALTRDLSPEGRHRSASAAEEVSDQLMLQYGAAALRQELRLGEKWRGPILSLVEELAAGNPPGDAALVNRLRLLVSAYPAFQQLVDLETTELRNLANTRRSLLAELRRTGCTPEWVEQAEVALEAHRLSSIMRQRLAANPDDLTEVSVKLKEGQNQRRQRIEEIIRRKRRLQVREALNDPQTSIPLRDLKTLLGRKRLTDSLISLKDKINYQAVLNVFPAWICTIDDAARLFPLDLGLFDYMIIDEASQCSQATALPLAYRAKRMIVVGDEHQLQPATSRFLRQASIDLLQREHGVVDHPRSHVLNGRDSLLELAEHCSNHRVFLDEHFRCDPAIIRWSNRRFYNNQLQILTHRRTDAFQVALELRELTSADDDPERKRNRPEAEAVVAEARRMIESGEAARMKIGLISPFREQANLLQTLLLRTFEDRPEWLDEYGLVASTADGFQGDERDIILYSFRYGPSTPPQSVISVQAEYQRLNVAFTRAKRKAICFVSSPLSKFPKGHIRDFLAHAREVENTAGNGGTPEPDRPDQFDSEFERDVCRRLRDRGLKVTTQEPVSRFLIDLVVEDSEGRVLGVECDGAWKFDQHGLLRPQDYQRQDIIERAGWTIHRISGAQYHLNPIAEIDRVEQVLRRQRTAAERQLTIGPVRPSVRTTVEEIEERPAVERPDDRPPPEQREERTDDEGREEPPLVREARAAYGPDQTRDGFAFMGDIEVEPIFAVRGLFRWYMLRNELEGAAADELNEILEEMRFGRPVTTSQLEYLEGLWQAAIRRGFDPDDDTLMPLA